MREKEKDSQSWCKAGSNDQCADVDISNDSNRKQIVYAADNAKATTNNDSGDTVTSPKKIISVVYDDSVWQENAGHMRIIPCRH